jgi:hypothetical protein
MKYCDHKLEISAAFRVSGIDEFLTANFWKMAGNFIVFWQDINLGFWREID